VRIRAQPIPKKGTGHHLEAICLISLGWVFTALAAEFSLDFRG
jgi:hypothetical protein